MVVYFHTHLHGLFERGSSNGKNHKLLQTQVDKSQPGSIFKKQIESYIKRHACIASLFPACEPPLMTLNAGTGNTKCLLPAMFAICCIQKTW